MPKLSTTFRLALVTCAGLLTGSVHSAWASSSYGAQALAYFNLSDGDSGEPFPITKSVGLDNVPVGSGTPGTLTTLGYGSADRGALGSAGDTILNSVNLGVGHIDFYGVGSSTFSFDDLIITPTTAANPSGTVPISVNMLLNGSYSTLMSFNNYAVVNAGVATASIHLQLNMSVNGNNYIGTVDSSMTADASGNQTPSSSSSGLLSTFTGSGPVSLDGVTVPVGTPFSLSINLEASSGIEVFGASSSEFANFSGSALADYANGLQLASHFTLPDGYTINSAEGGIVDNNFTAPIPEPASLSLLVFGGLGLLALSGVKARFPRVS